MLVLNYTQFGYDVVVCDRVNLGKCFNIVEFLFGTFVVSLVFSI